MTDKRILKLFLRRDESALGEVMEKYGDLCLKIAEKHLPSRDEAEECVNEALIELWHNIPQDRPRDLPEYITETVLLCSRGEKRQCSVRLPRARGKAFLSFAAAVLILCLIPAFLFLPPKTPAEDTTAPEESTLIPETEETAPLVIEHDGTPGVLYEIAEDGKSARFIGFGDCKEETVVIASFCNGLPVTEMLIGEIRDLENREDQTLGNYDNYGSAYLKHLIISDTVEVVSPHIITFCKNIESVYYGKNVRDIGKDWFTRYRTHQNFTTLEVSPENEIYYSRGNCIIERATKTLVRGCKGSVIPDDGSVEIIGERAFCFVKGLTAIDIPESVTVIADQAFYNCRNLKSIVLPANLQSLGESVFVYCNIKSVDLNGYTVLPKAVFQSCFALSEIKGSENLTEICEEALDSCSKLNITLGKSLKKIGKYAFMDYATHLTYQGTKEEWNAIEKDRYWTGYTTSVGNSLVVIGCSNGGINVYPMHIPRN